MGTLQKAKWQLLFKRQLLFQGKFLELKAVLFGIKILCSLL